jgi:peptidoglycan hydrolase-like amidase
MVSLRRPYYLRNILIVVTLIAVSGCATSRTGRRTEPSFREPSYTSANVPRLKEPFIRIGLKTDARSITISADEKIYFSDGSRSRSKESPIIVGLSFLSEVPTEYFVQLGSYSTRQNAENAQRELKTKHPTRIFANPDLGKFQLRAGPFSSQEKAQAAVEELKTRGFPGAFYVSDTPESARLPELILRDEIGDVLLRTSQPVHLWTLKQIISADSSPYRGYLTIQVNSAARLTLVNVLNFEDYLKGVVPNEIGPASEGTYQALKAQAVAARTYAYKNLRQFDDEGYDICATPRCQVYNGYKTENSWTTRAVEDTAGEILVYAGEPINALYTSTCGGRTENAEYMFEGWNYPYLKGVECYPEEEKISTRSVSLQGRPDPWFAAWLYLKTGIRIDQNLEAISTKQEIESTVPALLQSLGKTACASNPLIANNWIALADVLVSQLCWERRRDSLLDRKDYQYFVNRLQLPVTTTPEIESLLFLIHESIVILPEQDRTFDPYTLVKRKDLWQTLYNVLKHYHQINTTEGIAREISRSQLQVVDDQGVHSYGLDRPFFLYQKLGDRLTPRNQLNCAPGDNVEYLLDGDRVLLLVCEVDPAGVSMDRSSKLTFWQETITPEELGKKVAKYLDIGDIYDVQPLSYGVSQRVYEMKITGSRGSGTLRGIRVRWALGLKDNLFTIERTFDRSGKIKQFIFTGRGWGHGVGMCQVGAIGYAKQGKDYEQILKHYYTGVQIVKEY